MCRSWIAALVWVVLGGQLHGQALLAPPMERAWGESPSGLLQWAEMSALDVTVVMSAEDRDLQVFRFEKKGQALPDVGAHRMEARYHVRGLYEVTLSFDTAGRRAQVVKGEFDSLRKTLEARYGRMRVNGKNRRAENDFIFRDESLHYEPSPRVFLLMAFSEVEDTLREVSEARYSLLYHNGNFAPEDKE